MNEWETCQNMVEHFFGEKPETPQDLIKIMICMADTILDLRNGTERSQKLPS